MNHVLSLGSVTINSICIHCEPKRNIYSYFNGITLGHIEHFYNRIQSTGSEISGMANSNRSSPHYIKNHFFLITLKSILSFAFLLLIPKAQAYSLPVSYASIRNTIIFINLIVAGFLVVQSIKLWGHNQRSEALQLHPRLVSYSNPCQISSSYSTNWGCER